MMEFKLALVLFAYAVAAAHCCSDLLVGPRTQFQRDRGGLGIYKGKNTTIDKYPYMCTLVVEEKVFCGCSIVSDSWVLTSGDCCSVYSASSITIVVASQDGVSGKKYKIKQLVVHPKYTPDLDYDVCVLQANKDFVWNNKTQPIKLPSKKPADKDTKMMVSGYGATGPSLKGNSSLQDGMMIWKTKKFCKDTYASFGFPWTKRMGCAYNKGKTTPCQGDWADPFVKSNSNEDNVLYGIFLGGASSGFCTDEAVASICGDIFSVAPWIKKITGAKYDYE